MHETMFIYAKCFPTQILRHHGGSKLAAVRSIALGRETHLALHSTELSAAFLGLERTKAIIASSQLANGLRSKKETQVQHNF